MLNFILAGIPLGRMGDPREIGALTLYLCGPAGAYTTGGVVPVGGGVELDGVEGLGGGDGSPHLHQRQGQGPQPHQRDGVNERANRLTYSRQVVLTTARDRPVSARAAACIASPIVEMYV